MQSYLDKYVPTKASELTEAEFAEAKRSFDPNWGAPLSTRMVLGTYDDPEQWWKNFNKYYNEEETIDLSGVPGYRRGDIGIPVKDAKNKDDPEWTVFNPDGLDFGDAGEHGDIVANILGYAGVKTLAAGAATPGGPVAQAGAILASEAKANLAAQGAEALYDTAVRGLADPYHGDLENDGIGEEATKRGMAYGIETVAGTGAEVGMNMGGAIGRGVKEAVKWPFKKLFRSPDHPTATKINEAGEEVPMTHAEVVGQTKRDLEFPSYTGMSEKEIREKLDYNQNFVNSIWSGHGKDLDKKQEDLASLVQTIYRTNRKEATKWLDTLVDPKTTPAERDNMLTLMAAAQENIFPIRIGLPSAGSVSNNRLIQLGEGFANLFPLGHEVFEKSYNDMIRDIHKGMENISNSWVKGRRYLPRDEDDIDMVILDSIEQIKAMDSRLDDFDVGEVFDGIYHEWTIDQKLGLIEDLEAAAATGVFPTLKGNRNYFTRHAGEGANDPIAYRSDMVAQHRADRGEYGGRYSDSFWRTGTPNYSINYVGKDGKLQNPRSEWLVADPDGKTGDLQIKNYKKKDIDNYLHRILEGSPFASEDTIGGFARQGLEYSHQNRMRQFDVGFNKIYREISKDNLGSGEFDIVPEAASTRYRVLGKDGVAKEDLNDPAFTKLMSPNLSGTTQLRNTLRQEMDRISPANEPIRRAFKQADNIVKGLQPDYGIAEDILTKLTTPPDMEGKVGDALGGLDMPLGDAKGFMDLMGNTADIEDIAMRQWAEHNIELVPLLDDLELLKSGKMSSQGEDIFVNPDKFNEELSRAVAKSGDPELAKLMDDFDKSVPTIKDVIREYDRLGEIIGTNTDPNIPTQELQRLRDVLYQDIHQNMMDRGNDSPGFLGEGTFKNWGNLWVNHNAIKEHYLNNIYYPKLRGIIESQSDKKAYDLLFEQTREGPNNLKTFMDNMDFDAQNAIKAATFLRLGKANPQNYDYSDFDLHKFVREWDRIPESNKEILWGTEGGLRGSMENLAKQIKNLEHIQDRAGQGAVGQIVAATVIVGGLLGAFTGATFTGDLEATATGALTGGIGVPVATLGASWGLGKILTNKKLIDRIVGINEDALNAGRKGKLKEFFGDVKGGFRIGVNRLIATGQSEGLGPEIEIVVNNMFRGVQAAEAELNAKGWGDFDPTDMSVPSNMQNLLEGMSEAQGIELRHDMTPQDIKDLETIYREMGRSP